MFMLLFGFGTTVAGQGMLGPIEQEYFQKAKAKNYAIMAARYSSKSEFQTRVAWEMLKDPSTSTTAKAHADTASMHCTKALRWVDSTLANAAYSDTAAIQLVESAKYYLHRVHYALSLVPDATKWEDLDHYLWKAVTSSSHASIDAYHASLLLNDGQLERTLALSDSALTNPKATFLEEGPPELAKVERLEADEAAYTDLTNSFADRIKDKMDQIVELQATLKVTADPEVRTRLEQDLAILRGDQERLEGQLVASTGQLQSIREIMSDSLVGPVAQTVPSGTFSPPAHVDNPDLDCDLVLPDGLIYKVQIGYFFPENEERFANFKPLTCEAISDRLVRYFAGQFSSYKEATLAKNYLRQHWFADAFVVPYFSGLKISTSEALRLEWLLGDE